MLTDDEVDAIREGVAENLRGPIVQKWLGQLLDDREERVRNLEPTLHALLRRARNVLRDMEGNGNADGWSACPDCAAPVPEPHDSRCDLDATARAIEAILPPDEVEGAGEPLPDYHYPDEG